MNKRYENKTAFDPGRFRYSVTFLQENVSIAEDGSQTVSFETILTTRAVKEAVTRRFSLHGDTTIDAAATVMNSYWYFIIRYRRGFAPLKDMLLLTDEGVYTIVAAPELDQPPNYYRMLCIKTDRQITT